MANEFAADMLSKSQEHALTGDTSVGISESENMKEYATVIEDDKKHDKKKKILDIFETK